MLLLSCYSDDTVTVSKMRRSAIVKMFHTLFLSSPTIRHILHFVFGYGFSVEDVIGSSKNHFEFALGLLLGALLEIALV